MLDINHGRQVFADYLQANWHKSKSLDAALMAAIEFAYRRGLEDGAAMSRPVGITDLIQQPENVPS